MIDYENDIAVIDDEDIDIEEPKDYALVLINDNYTTQEFVVTILKQICHKTSEEAEKIMMDVHKKGKGIGYTGTYDICITKSAQIMQAAQGLGFPLKTEVSEL